MSPIGPQDSPVLRLKFTGYSNTEKETVHCRAAACSLYPGQSAIQWTWKKMRQSPVCPRIGAGESVT